MSMYLWAYYNYRWTAVRQAQSTFTPEELASLLALRSRIENCSIDIELDLNERRLLFARWLIDHGKLSDDPAHAR